MPDFNEFQKSLIGYETPDGGGASRFLDFLVEDLKPFIAEKFDVTDAGWTIFGASLGGLFSLFALLHCPAAFQRYLITNPSVWHGYPVMQDLAREFAARKDPVAASAYFVAGAMETREEQAPHFKKVDQEKLQSIGGVPDMSLDMMEIAALVRKRQGLRVRAETVVGEDHFSVAGSALTRGLRWLHSPIPE